jgi:PIN domain nuclease of toxin-antitoxin system
MPYVADTHALVWFFTNSPKLGQAALQILREADAGREVIIIPTIVLGELMSICKSGKVALDFSTTLTKLEIGDNYQIVPLDLPTIKAANNIQAELEMHDRFIVATAQLLSMPVLTKDEMITQSGTVNAVW